MSLGFPEGKVGDVGTGILIGVGVVSIVHVSVLGLMLIHKNGDVDLRRPATQTLPSSDVRRPVVDPLPSFVLGGRRPVPTSRGRVGMSLP